MVAMSANLLYTFRVEVCTLSIKNPIYTQAFILRDDKKQTQQSGSTTKDLWMMMQWARAADDLFLLQSLVVKREVTMLRHL
jgi:hypothetical protein